ncbi:MAG: hypothetical protein LBU04_00730 [Christensenellaceae bacterium]|jgi:hypothetical protein|nr:hypothetical protein [Christensenellaceae bacterium]
MVGIKGIGKGLVYLGFLWNCEASSTQQIHVKIQNKPESSVEVANNWIAVNADDPKTNKKFLQPQSLPSDASASSSKCGGEISESVEAVLQSKRMVRNLLRVGDQVEFIEMYASNSASYCVTLQGLYNYWEGDFTKYYYIKLYIKNISNAHPLEVWSDGRDDDNPSECDGTKVVEKAENLYSLMQEREIK